MEINTPLARELRKRFNAFLATSGSSLTAAEDVMMAVDRVVYGRRRASGWCWGCGGMVRPNGSVRHVMVT